MAVTLRRCAAGIAVRHRSSIRMVIFPVVNRIGFPEAVWAVPSSAQLVLASLPRKSISALLAATPAKSASLASVADGAVTRSS